LEGRDVCNHFQSRTGRAGETCVTETTLRCALCIVTFLFGASDSVSQIAETLAAPDVIAQPRPKGTAELARVSEFVGLIHAFPLVEDPVAAWKQWIFVESVDPLKGDLGRGAGTNRYPYIGADHSVFTGYPTWFAGKGEYVVFLHRESIERKVVWVTTAAFAIEFRPDRVGTIVGTLYGEGLDRRAMTVDEVRTLLRRIVSGERIGSDAERVLDQLLTAAALSPASRMVREPATFEQRFEQVKALAGGIRSGTRRADVEKVFPVQDGGLYGKSSSSRYYAGSEVMVAVPFDQNGGAWSGENRVTGPLRVYRSRMHID
jgi:hypothetical protein